MTAPGPSTSAGAEDNDYASGTGARVSPGKRPLGLLTWLALLHAGSLLVWTTWAYGGGAQWMRPHFAWWGSLGVLLTLAALKDAHAWREGWMRPLRWLWPLAAFNLLVLAGCLNPAFREVPFDNETVLMPQETSTWLPTSARPALALHALWLFNALWIPCFNLVLLVRQRRAIRGLLMVAVLNALALSIFGTVQKFSRATGPYFGHVETPQSYFFASFIYHNHWGAFILLMLAACLGLIWHQARRHDVRSFFNSPAFTGVVTLFFLAATVPLSGSRSSTMLAVLLFGAAFLHWAVHLVRSRRRHGMSAVLPLGGALAAVVVAAAGIWFVAADTITQRAALTRSQVRAIVDRGGLGERSALYHETWRMAQDRPAFGWGMASYPHVFTLYNRQSSPDGLPVFYRDAHSDWLQAAAEHGLIGTALLSLCALVPLSRLRWSHLRSPLTLWLLAGCAVLLLYAVVEFPFGNVSVVFTWWLCFFGAIQYGRLHDREAPAPVKAISSNP